MAIQPDSIRGVLDAFVSETGRDLRLGTRELAQLAVAAQERLALAVGEPGFDGALIRERDALAIRAGIASVAQADALDGRLIGIIHAVLTLGVAAI